MKILLKLEMIVIKKYGVIGILLELTLGEI